MTTKQARKVSVVFEPYVDVLKKMNVLGGYKTYNADRGAKREFVQKKIVPLLNQAVRHYNNPKTRMVRILAGRVGDCPEIKAIKKSLNNLWKYRPRKTKLEGTALIDPKAREAMQFLEKANEGNFKTVSFHQARSALKGINVKIPENTKKNILMALAKAMSFKFRKGFFDGV